eukprot:comp5672_c0_seq1/m.1553 comp5672_c0_seq1/g.1553  ORF comp5672_c0_seq1/g.1553 comp5672_c0_seq1/m.1553 type:complete len:374 (-) comp5672_c0_seq1:107-1228(-)
MIPPRQPHRHRSPMRQRDFYDTSKFDKKYKSVCPEYLQRQRCGTHACQFAHPPPWVFFHPETRTVRRYFDTPGGCLKRECPYYHERDSRSLSWRPTPDSRMGEHLYYENRWQGRGRRDNNDDRRGEHVYARFRDRSPKLNHDNTTCRSFAHKMESSRGMSAHHRECRYEGRRPASHNDNVPVTVNGSPKVAPESSKTGTPPTTALPLGKLDTPGQPHADKTTPTATRKIQSPHRGPCSSSTEHTLSAISRRSSGGQRGRSRSRSPFENAREAPVSRRNSRNSASEQHVPVKTTSAETPKVFSGRRRSSLHLPLHVAPTTSADYPALSSSKRCSKELLEPKNAAESVCACTGGGVMQTQGLLPSMPLCKFIPDS